jgi:LuxR family maltose regulon positive regulatory protein
MVHGTHEVEADAVVRAEVMATASRDMPWMLIGKLEPPQQRVATTPRHELLERLDQGLRGPVTIVMSPPGFGKTTLLAQWWRRLRGNPSICAAWLTLDDNDSEVTRFVGALIQSAGHAGVSLGPLELTVPEQLPDANVRRAVNGLIECVRACRQRLVIFLDDYHRVHCPAVDSIVEWLIRDGSETVHVVVSGRDRPRLAVADLAARGLATVLDARDLVLTRAEVGAIFGPEISEAEISILHERTEGWAVALQLARLWLNRATNRSERIRAFSVRCGELAHYLLEQVLNDLTPEFQSFLLDTSILERFNAELSDAVRDQSDSRALLQSLAHFDALLVPLDPEREWFRYHHLFADFLRQYLASQDPERAATLHARAARWLATTDDVLEAVRHAQSAGDSAYAIEIAGAAGGWEVIITRGTGFVRGLLKNFSATEVQASAFLQLAHSYLQIKLGDLDGARQSLDRLEKFPGRTPSMERDHRIVTALLCTYSDDIGDPKWITLLATEADRLPSSDLMGRGALHALCALGALAVADFAYAERQSRVAIRELRAAGSVLGLTYCYVHLAQANFYRGRLREAESLYRETLVTSVENHGPDNVLKAVGSALLARVMYWRGEDRESARILLRTALPTLESHNTWFDVYSAAYQTAMSIERADEQFEAALEMVNRASVTAEARRLPRLHELTHCWRLEVLVDAGLIREADQLVRESQLEERVRQEFSPSEWKLRQALTTSLARWYLRTGQSAAALELLRPVRAMCSASEQHVDCAQLDVLLALAYKQRGDPAPAITHFESALEYVGTERAVRVFLDFGSSVEPLFQNSY